MGAGLLGGLNSTGARMLPGEVPSSKSATAATASWAEAKKGWQWPSGCRPPTSGVPLHAAPGIGVRVKEWGIVPTVYCTCTLYSATRKGYYTVQGYQEGVRPMGSWRRRQLACGRGRGSRKEQWMRGSIEPWFRLPECSGLASQHASDA